MQQLFADFPNAVGDPKECFGWRELPRQLGCPSQLSPLLLSAAHSGPTVAQFTTRGPADANKTNSTNPSSFPVREAA